MSSSGNGVARGAFIVIEGLDRAGKSTQVSLLAKSLDARSLKFPGMLGNGQLDTLT